MLQKIVGYLAFNVFWEKLKKWLDYNFESLFTNDADLDSRLTQLEEKVKNLESTNS